MRILFLSTWFPFPPDNGSKIRAYYLLRALAKIHRVTLVAFNPDPQTQFPVQQDVEIGSVSADPFRYVHLPQMVKYLSPIPLVCWRIKEMETMLAQPRYQEMWDAIVAVQVPVARYALRFAGVPFVLDVDTSYSHQLRERYQEQKTRMGRLRTWVSWYKAYRYERALFKKFQACAIVSPLEVTSMQAMTDAGTHVSVIPNGVDCVHHHPGIAEVQPHTLIYNGALTYSANYDAMQYFLADIYPLIKQEIPDISLKITGSTKGVNTTDLQLDASVHLTGYVEDIRLPVAQSAVCVVPLRQGSGTRLKILEAMALGTPVVTTSKGAEGLDVIDDEHLMVRDTPEAFADAVIHVINDSDLSERLRRNARTLVEMRYDWETIGAQFANLVEETVAMYRAKQDIS